MNKCSAVLLAVTVAALTGCGGELHSRVVPTKIKGKIYNMQVHAQPGLYAVGFKLAVNDKVIGEGTLTPMKTTQSITEYYDKVLFESECSMATASSGVGRVYNCNFFAGPLKKLQGSATF
jgi:hypothetical protein